MGRKENDHELDDVLEAYATSLPGPSRQALEEWATRHPGYARQLAEFTAEWLYLDRIAPQDEASEEPSAYDRDLAILHSVMQAKGLGPDIRQAPARLSSIFKEAASLQLSPRQVAEKVALSVPILAKLEHCAIRFASIPSELVEKIARVLQRPVEDVATYLQHEPRFRLMSYRSEGRLTPRRQQDFVDTLRMDVEIDDSDRGYWLDVIEHGREES
jgi:hypothetical protein